jgi:hypothetical protein
MLRRATVAVPAFERYFSPQTIQNTIPLWTAFFRSGGIPADEFAAALARAVKTAEGRNK